MKTKMKKYVKPALMVKVVRKAASGCCGQSSFDGCSASSNQY